MADTTLTLARDLIAGTAADAVARIPKQLTATLKLALILEEAQGGGDRVTVVAALRGELRRRGYLRRPAAQRGALHPETLQLLLGLAAVLFLLLLALLVVSGRAEAGEWFGAPTARVELFPGDDRCTTGDLVRPQLDAPVYRDGPLRIGALFEHESCFGERDLGEERIGLSLELEL